MAKATDSKSDKKAEKPKRKANPALMKPMQPDAVLAAVVGDEAMPRSEITKRIWDYIKKHDLQDAENRRMINADDTLKALFDGKLQVSMFELPKFVGQHIS